MINFKNHCFGEKMRKYEQKLVEILSDTPNIRFQNKKISLIMAYFIIHRQLTQSQLKELTNLPASTLSRKLVRLIEMGKLIKKKKPIPGTHIFVYMLNGSILEFTSSPFEMLKGINLHKNFFEALLEKIKSLKIQKDEYFEKYSSKVEFFLIRFQIYEKCILSIYPLLEEQWISIQESNARNPLPIKQKYNDLESIERDHLSMFLNSNFILGQNRTKIVIVGYFVIRETLTRESIMELTGLSASTITRVLKDLTEIDLIYIAEVLKSGQFIYKIKPTLDQIILTPYEHIFKWKPRLLEIKNDLEQNEAFLNKELGYDTIYTVIIQYLQLISIYEKLLNKIKRALK